MALQRLHPSGWSLVLCNLKLPSKRRKFSIFLEINTSVELQLLILSRTRPIPARPERRRRAVDCGQGRRDPLRPCCSAHFRDDVVHGVVHGDTQLVDTFTHLRFHGIPAAGRHHPQRGASRQAGAHADPKSGTWFHFSHSFSGMGLVWPKGGALCRKRICQNVRRGVY